MAQDPNQQSSYPTSADPKLIKEGELKSDENMEDHDLKQWEEEEHIGYVRKVLGIVCFQLTFTFLLCVLSSTIPVLGKFFKHPLTLIFSFIVMMFAVCRIFFDKELRRTVP